MASGRSRLARYLARGRRTVPPMRPHAQAVVDAFERGTPTRYLHVSSWGRTWISSEDTLGDPRTQPVDARALSLCAGRVLDLGAGAGRHALVLQEEGHAVTAVELEPMLVELMRRRGVRDAREGDAFTVEGTFDTVLLLGDGLGMVGDLPGLLELLAHLRGLLAEGGRLLVQSTQVHDWAPAEMRLEDALSHGLRYPGESRSRTFYKGLRGERFPWLYVSDAMLVACAGRTGWACEVVFEDHRQFLARLTLAGRAAEGPPAGVTS